MTRSFRKESKGWQIYLLSFFAPIGMVASFAFVGSIFGFDPERTVALTHMPCIGVVYWLFKSYFKEAAAERERECRQAEFKKDWEAGLYKDVDFNHQILRPLTYDDVPPLQE